MRFLRASSVPFLGDKAIFVAALSGNYSSLILTLHVAHSGSVAPASGRAPPRDFPPGAGPGLAASASITHEALKTEARVYSVRQTPAGPLFLLWVPLSLRVQPPAPLVSRVARQRQRGSLSDTRSRRADADGILKTGFFWVARVSWPLRPWFLAWFLRPVWLGH